MGGYLVLWQVPPWGVWHVMGGYPLHPTPPSVGVTPRSKSTRPEETAASYDGGAGIPPENYQGVTRAEGVPSLPHPCPDRGYPTLPEVPDPPVLSRDRLPPPPIPEMTEGLPPALPELVETPPCGLWVGVEVPLFASGCTGTCEILRGLPASGPLRGTAGRGRFWSMHRLSIDWLSIVNRSCLMVTGQARS